MPDAEGPMPDVREGILDGEGIAALFRDIGALTEVDEIIVKDRPGRADDTPGVTLAEAERLVQSGEVRAVQIRYRHDGAHWWDTLMCTPEGVRIVRVRHGFDGG